jgi:hypothetical protein
MGTAYKVRGIILYRVWLIVYLLDSILKLVIISVRG